MTPNLEMGSRFINMTDMVCQNGGTLKGTSFKTQRVTKIQHNACILLKHLSLNTFLQTWRAAAAAAAAYAFMTSEGGCRAVLFCHEGIGPEQSCKGSYFLTAPQVLLHHRAHHYHCQNLCAEYELWLMGRAGCGRRHREGAGRRRRGAVGGEW